MSMQTTLWSAIRRRVMDNRGELVDRFIWDVLSGVEYGWFDARHTRDVADVV